MIHHLSIPAKDPLHVTKVLVELFGGMLTQFGPYRDSYIAWAGDEYGTAIEVYPLGTEMFPDTGDGQANFKHNEHASPFVATHATVSVDRSKEEILALAQREGWRAIELSRGSFRVIEFWIENHVMLEITTKEMAQEYLHATATFRPNIALERDAPLNFTLNGTNQRPAMSTVQAVPLPAGALLDNYAKNQAYTDCYSVKVPRSASLSEFVEAFYTTPLFKLERLLLSVSPGFRSTDAEARELAQGARVHFAAWSVEAREPNQILLASGRTRSWLMVGASASAPGTSKVLFFGSAIVPHRSGHLGWQFNALLGFHKLYSRLLLAAAARRLANRKSGQHANSAASQVAPPK